MIKFVRLSVSGGHPVPTGFTPVRRIVQAAPRDITKPVSGRPHSNSFADRVTAGGTWRNPPKARPHILRGWVNHGT